MICREKIFKTYPRTQGTDPAKGVKFRSRRIYGSEDAEGKIREERTHTDKGPKVHGVEEALNMGKGNGGVEEGSKERKNSRRGASHINLQG